MSARKGGRKKNCWVLNATFKEGARGETESAKCFSLINDLSVAFFSLLENVTV